MRTPEAEVEIDAALVMRLVDAQFPEFSAPVRILANGWDNVVARLGDKHLVRLPRRAAAAPLVRNEATWLPRLAPSLPVRVPAPHAVGSASDEYPWTWTIVPWIPGRPATSVPVGHRRGLASELARVHRALHVEAPEDAPRNPVRGVPLADRAVSVEERLAGGGIPGAGTIRAALDDALAAPPPSGPLRWLHGDPHPGNLLATDSPVPRLAALIDFGDICAGDPATDLAIAWTAFDADARADYRAELRPDESTWRRARGWAAVLATVLATTSDDHPGHAAIAVHTVAQLEL